MAMEVQMPVAPDHQPDPPAPSPYTFSFSDFLRREYRFGIAPDRPVCKAYVQGHCPLGNNCPDKHQSASSSFDRNLVCKHWLRGLCKKGDICDFLHEYNRRKMPECTYYIRNGHCQQGDDCLYLHTDPDSKRAPCPHYDRGFCPLGPHCALKHVKKDRLCPFYMAGFCPEGKGCKNGAHARFPTDLKKPEVRVIKTEEELEKERMERELEAQRREQEELDREDRNPGSQPHGGRNNFRGGWGGDRKKRRGGGRHRRNNY